MGGIVARATFQMKNYQYGSVKTIFSLSSPQKYSLFPVLPLRSDSVALVHRSLENFYATVNSFWQEEFSKEHSSLSDVVIISIAGGNRDTLVRSDLTSLASVVPPSHGLTVISTSIPNVWLSIDHQVRIDFS